MRSPALTQRFGTTFSLLGGEVLDSVVEREARRSLINVVGAAIGASRQGGVDILVRHARTYGGAPTVPIPGRDEQLDALNAALVIGFAAHLDDFDDTHLETVIHPGAATLAAVLPVALEVGASAEQALHAFALGCESQLRLGVAMSPSHYDAGWHITGTCGVVGAAVASAQLLGLSRDQLLHALATAASQTVGVREAFGTMAKPFHPGKAASNGVLAAKLAQRGFTGNPEILEHRQGFFSALARELDPDRLEVDAPAGWELLKNTYKPYPCGIVIHPVIDAAIAVHESDRVDANKVRAVRVRCHPLVTELTGNPRPEDGLQARFSAIHGAAVGLRFGRASLREYEDEVVRSPELVDLRAKIELIVDDSTRRDEARIEVETSSGVVIEQVEHARGSLDRPLTDDELDAKFLALAEPVLGGRAGSLLATLRGLGVQSWHDLVTAMRGDAEPGQGKEVGS